MPSIQKERHLMTGDALFFILYATAQLTPSAVPTAANSAEARFHRNFISLDLFSLVITLIL